MGMSYFLGPGIIEEMICFGKLELMVSLAVTELDQKKVETYFFSPKMTCNFLAEVE